MALSELDKEARKILGSKIKAIRMQRGLTIEEVAAATGIPYATLSSYEAGKRPANSKEHKETLEQFYTISLDELNKESYREAMQLMENAPEPAKQEPNTIKSALKELQEAKKAVKEKAEEVAKNPLSPEALNEMQKLTRITKTTQDKVQRILLETYPIKFVPIYFNNVPAGYPLDIGEDDIEGWHPVPMSADVDCAVKVKGDSLQDVGISTGDIILLNTNEPAEPGDLVVAAIGNEYTVKYLVQENGKYVLRAANGKYQDIEIPENDFRVVGVVKGIFKETPVLRR